MGIGFEAAISVNLIGTVSAKIQLRFSDFSEDEFLLALSQPIGLQLSRLQIRTQHPRKPMVTCFLPDH